MELSSGERLPCKAVVGCDGVKSRIAASLGLKPARYAGEVYYRSGHFFAFERLRGGHDMIAGLDCSFCVT